MLCVARADGPVVVDRVRSDCVIDALLYYHPAVSMLACSCLLVENAR